METKLPKIWITKHALTTGVTTAVNVTVSAEGRMAEFDQDSMLRRVYVHKPHWHATEAEATTQVRKMIVAKLNSLDKERAKLDALRETLAGGLNAKPWKQVDPGK